ncbi:hypothetical protein HK101_000604, partial [Irineochytrium annulatum]
MANGTSRLPLLRMKNLDFSYFVVLIVLILPLRAIVYLSPAFVASLAIHAIFPGLPYLSFLDGMPVPARILALCYTFTESCWLIYYLRLRGQMSYNAAAPPGYSASDAFFAREKEVLGKNNGEEAKGVGSVVRDRTAHTSRRALFDRCALEATRDPQAFVSNWFFGAPISSIGRDDVAEWISWAFFAKHLKDLKSEEELSDLEYMVSGLERVLGLEGKGGLKRGSMGAKCMRHTLDEMESQMRPLIYYV